MTANPIWRTIVLPLLAGALLLAGCPKPKPPPEPVPPPPDEGPAVQIDALVPPKTTEGRAVTVTVEGFGFEEGQDVFLGGDPVRGLDVLSGTEFTFRATDDLKVGDYDLRVVRADGEQALARGAFAVESGRTYDGDCTLVTAYFDFDESSLTNDARRLLAANARCMESRGFPRVRLEGHADERGSTVYNLSLGQRRAESVRTYLLNVGVGTTELGTLSYGEERPADTGSSEAAWSKNRRVEFVIQ